MPPEDALPSTREEVRHTVHRYAVMTPAALRPQWGAGMPVIARVPGDLRTAPFLGRDAVAKELLTRNQLRSRCWRRLLRGVYVHESVELTPEVRFEAVRLVMPDDVVAAGLLAAWLHGVWVPREGRAVPLDVSRPVPAGGDGRAGVNQRRLTLRGSADWFGAQCGYSALDNDVGERDGVRLTSPLRTCFDLMRERRLVEAVVVADAFLYAAAVNRTLLAAYVADRRRWPHIREARVAVDLSRDGSRSPGETRVRMVVVLAGFPEPWVNVPVVKEHSDIVMATTDLLLPGPRPVGLEYDGAYHDDVSQWARDRRRSNRLTTSSGLPLLRYDRISVRDERRLMVDEIREISGLRPWGMLDDADFWRPRADRAW